MAAINSYRFICEAIGWNKCLVVDYMMHFLRNEQIANVIGSTSGVVASSSAPKVRILRSQNTMYCRYTLTRWHFPPWKRERITQSWISCIRNTSYTQCDNNWYEDRYSDFVVIVTCLSSQYQSPEQMHRGSTLLPSALVLSLFYYQWVSCLKDSLNKTMRIALYDIT